MISKKKLLFLVEKKLNEMPIDYGDAPERMNPDIERKLASQETPFKDNPALPQPGGESNYEEIIASKRFLDVVNKVKHYSGIEGNVTSQNSLAQLVNSGRKALMDIFTFERNRRQELEALAVELVKKEMAIPEGALQFDAKLVDLGGISDEGFQHEEQNPEEEESNF